MTRIIWLVAIASAFALTSCGSAEPPQVHIVPLAKVWAFDMPGTSEIQELEPEKFGEATRELSGEETSKLLIESKTFQIRAALKAKKPEEGGRTESGFAVIGTAREALDGAWEVLVKGKRPVETFSTLNNVTLVFFSHLCGQSVGLKQVQRQGHKIEIQYQFIPHMTANMTWHIALIPVGTLPAGRYRVDIVQVPAADTVGHLAGGLSAAEAHRIVCQSFSFSIVDQKTKD